MNTEPKASRWRANASLLLVIPVGLLLSGSVVLWQQPVLLDWSAFSLSTPDQGEGMGADNRCPDSPEAWGQKPEFMSRGPVNALRAGLDHQRIQVPGAGVFREGALEVYRFRRGDFRWRVLTEKPADGAFFINANFHDKQGLPLGLLLSQGRVIQKPDRANGVFVVGKGGPRVQRRPGPLKGLEAGFQGREMPLRQGRLVGNGRRNTKVKPNASLRNFRSLLGQAKNGDLILVVSGPGGLVTLPEIACVARHVGVYNGMVPDGGVSLDYGHDFDGAAHRFQSLPQPFYRWGGHFPQTSWLAASPIAPVSTTKE